MKIRLFAVSLTFIALPLLISCGSKHQETPTSAKTETETKPNDPTTLIKAPVSASITADEIRYEAHCADTHTPETCLGNYGFTIFNNREYLVGPGPKGQKFGGRLKKEEFNHLWSAANQSLLSSTLQNELQGLHANTAAATSSESIQIKSGHRTFNIANTELMEIVKSLVSLYYPSTFPNPCIDAQVELSKSYEELVSCKYDSECTYVTEGYLPVDPNNRIVRTINTDDCTYLTPLSVANFLKLLTTHKELATKRELAVKACGASLQKPSCTEPRTLNPWASPAHCVESKCQAGISIEQAE